MSTETQVAVLFADVVGSTRLYEVLGDHAARDMIVACVDVMRDATERNRGNVIKTIGDEILSIFPTPDDAVNAFAALGAARFVAMHWGTFKLTDEDLREPPQLLRDIWQQQNRSSSQLEIPAIGETLVF